MRDIWHGLKLGEPMREGETVVSARELLIRLARGVRLGGMLLVFFCLAGTAPHAQTTDPQDELNVTAYPATLANLVNAAIKMHAIDLTNDNVIDDYARINYCDIYRYNHLDEFKWRRVRTVLRAQIDHDQANFPTTMFLERLEHFGSYDFQAGALLMRPDSILGNVTQLKLLNEPAGWACGDRLSALTQNFIALLDKPLSIDGIKMSEKEAQAVISGLSQIIDKDNVIRTAYGRYIVALDGSGRSPPGMGNAVVFLSRVLRVTFYEDPAYQKPFWRGLSSQRQYSQMHRNFQEIPFKGIDPTTGTPAEPAPDLPQPQTTLPPGNPVAR